MSEFRGSSSAQPDYSGLEVVPAGTAPEVVSASTAPEVDDSRSPAETLVEHHLYKLSVQAPLEPWRGADDAPQVRVVEKANDEISAPAPTPTPQPWWRRKVWIIALVAAVLVTVGVVVGVVVATRRADNPTPSNTTTPQPEDQPPSPPNTTRHPCDLTICPQILASALLNTWTSSPTLLLFARSATNNTLTYTTTTTTNLSLSPIFHPWQPLDLGAPLLSQPTALTWSNGTRASVFALSSPDHMVHTLKFTSISPSQQIQPPTQWQPLGGPSDSLIATCSPNGTRPDLWTTADREITHNFGIGPAFDAGWSVPSDSSWPRDVSFKTPLQRTRPGVVCGRSPRIHDIVMYGVDGAVRHVQFDEELGTGLWTAPTVQGGRFICEPAVALVPGSREEEGGGVYFFGVGEDRRMYHFQWWKRTGYTELVDLGGEFKSSASAVGGRGGTGRAHVVALGMDGRVKHLAVDVGGIKRTGWEDLGVVGNSAPLLVDVSGNVLLPERVGVFVVGTDGKVNMTTVTLDRDEPSWKGLVWKSIGGRVTTSFYQS